MDLVILCIKIFFARIIDVTLGTVRTIYSVKGKTFTAGFIAFFEISIWFMVVREALNTEMTNYKQSYTQEYYQNKRRGVWSFYY